MHRFSRAVRVPRVQPAVRGAAAAAVLVQQPVRRVPALPRLRQHHRARHGPGRARPDQVDPAERDRAVEQAALPRAARRAEARREEARAARRAVVRARRGREAVRHRRGRRRLGRGEGLLPLARAQEIQGPRPRVPQPLSRLPDLPGVRRRPAAPRGARRARRRAHDRRRLRPDGARTRTASSRRWRCPRRMPPSPTRCCARSASGSGSCATSGSTT